MDVTLPDGTVIQGVPEGTTKAQLADKLKANGRDVPQEWLQSQNPQPKESSVLDKAKGIGEAALSMATAIPAGFAGNVAGIYQGVTGGKYGTPEGAREAEQKAGEVASSLTYQPRTEEGKDYLSTASDVLQQSGIAGLPQTEGMTLARTAEQASPVIKGAAGKAVAKTSALPETIKQSITPDARTLALADKAKAYGIPIRPDMLSNNKIIKMVGEALEKVPLSGSKLEARQEAFNKAIIKSIGGDPKATKLTPDVYASAVQKVGSGIGEIGANNNIKITPEFTSKLNTLTQEANKFETYDVSKVINNYVDEIKVKSKDGVLLGEAYRKLDSKIGRQLAGTSNGDLKNALGELQETLRDELNENLRGMDKGKLYDLRKKYAYAKAIEPLVAKSSTGDIPASQLMGRVTSDNAGKSRMAKDRGGELGDLARIGQRFLKEPPSSGTAERSLAYGLLGGGAAVNPIAAGAIYGVANLYNRLGPKLSELLTKE